MGVINQVERLRPTAMQSRPVLMERVFDDPDAILQIIAERSPYLNLAEFHKMQETLGGPRTQPRFRSVFTDEIFLQNAQWLQAARESFSAKFVRPFKCIVNLNGPMPGGGVHLDLPVFRGFAAPEVPVWLLMNMTNSGLFQDWMVPIASGLAWFYRGAGGKFTYWPDGPGAPFRSETSPLWNRGVMSDNEYMWHAVGATGTEGEKEQFRGRTKDSDRLWYARDGVWEIRGDDGVSARLTPSQLRISLLWKAYVFKDERHLASFEDRTMDLTASDVVETYRRDLAARGLKVSPPTDLLNDPAWRNTLIDVYPQAFNEQSAGDYG